MLILWPGRYIVSFDLLRTSSIFWKVERKKEFRTSLLTKLRIFFSFSFFIFIIIILSLVRWQIVGIKLLSCITRGRVRNGFSHLRERWAGVWHGNCVNNCTGAKYEIILLLGERMQSTILCSPLLFHFTILDWRKMIPGQCSHNKNT